MQIDITMKHSVLIPSVALVLLMLVAGCDSFLEPEPQSFQTTANFYQNPDHFEQAVNGLYSEARFLFGDEEYRDKAERRGPTLTSHFDVNLPRTVGGHPQIEQWEITADNPSINALWQKVYTVVKEANVILGRVEEVEFEDSAQRDRIVGEALTLRAMAYWLAIQTWGDVPLILEEPRTPDDAATVEGGRTPVAQVYEQILTDLNEVVDNGYLPISYSGAQVGKLTDGAARFLLGRTYLLRGDSDQDYQNALTQFEALDDGRYRLLDDYREIFNPSNKNNDETIFELQYNPDIAGQPGWEPDDIGVYQHILPITATRDDLIPAAANAFVPEGNMMPTPDIIQSYDQDDDARYEASIAWHVHPDNSGSPEIAWPLRTTNSPAGDSIPYLYKYYWPDQVDSNGEGLNNWVVFRFADVLLSAAEAHWRLGSDGQAEMYLNRVRDRAGLDDFDPNTFDSFIIGNAVGDPLGNAILHERAIELLGEGHFWLDAKRFGADVARDVFEPYANRYRARVPRVQSAYVFQERGLLFPIPPREVDLAGLSQTPGW